MTVILISSQGHFDHTGKVFPIAYILKRTISL
jgi:hypothetical protein